MKPTTLNTKIFLDGGDPAETSVVEQALGWLDGQTTNPSLVAHNPGAAARLESGDLFTPDELLEFYRQVVLKASQELPDGSVSIEVYTDAGTTPEEMIAQARLMNTWIPNAHIKFPITASGLAAAETLVAEGFRVNMTLCFTQDQAAAVAAATLGASKGQVFVSPFVGRLDDTGRNGMDLIANILRMYQEEGSPVEVLAASVRNAAHLDQAIAVGSDILTAPKQVLLDWAAAGSQLPGADYRYDAKDLAPIPYQNVPTHTDWRDYDIQHDLTDAGIAKFAADWNALLKT